MYNKTNINNKIPYWEVPKTYDVKKAFEVVNIASAPSRIRESERIQDEYDKTVKLLDLTNRFRNQNKKEEEESS